MSVKKCGFIVTLLAQGFAADTGMTPLADHRENGLWEKIIKIDSDRPDMKTIGSLTAATIEDNTTRVRRLVVSSGESILRRLVEKDGGGDTTVAALAQRWHSRPQTGTFLLEVICIDANCIQRSRDRNGELRVKVVRGSSPLRFDLNDHVLDVVYVDIKPKSNLVDFYGRILNGTVTAAEALMRTLGKRLPGINVTLMLRYDELFLGAEMIPEGFWLWDEVYPITFDKYAKAPFCVCSIWRPKETPFCMDWIQRTALMQ